MTDRYKLRGEKKKAAPCRVCGCEERYVSNGTCPKCLLRQCKEWDSQNTHKRKLYQKRTGDKRNYGVCQDSAATARRRAIEDRQERQLEGNI